MAQYKTGTASVTNGSAVVTGTGTAWLANVTAGDGFVLAGVPVPYTVASVDSDTQITLSAPWAGSTTSGSIYAIFRDFTTQYNLPELAQGDIETATIWTRALRLIDQLQAASLVNHLAASDPHGQYLLETDYAEDNLRESLLAEATLNLDFANNRYEVYEGPVDSLTARPFNDVLDFTRSGPASARNATGGISNVLADEQRLVGNREGLLIEEQRTNLATNSESATAGWAEQTTTAPGASVRYVENDVTEAPDGDMTGNRMTDSTDADTQRIFRSFSPGEVAFVFSVFLKNDTRNYGGITTTGLVNPLIVDLRTGAITKEPSGDDLVGRLVEPYGNGWYRLSLILKAGANAVGQIGLSDSGGSLAYTGDGTKSIFYWGVQVEQGSFPTSYIKTEGSQVTRSADNCSRTLGSELNVQGEYTIYAEVDRTGNDGRGSPVFVFGSTSSGVFSLSNSGANNEQLVVRTDGVNQLVYTPSIFREKSKHAIAVSKTRLAAFVNGVGVENNGEFLLPNYSMGDIFQRGPSDKLNGKGKRLVIIPRALSATELEALTGGN